MRQIFYEYIISFVSASYALTPKNLAFVRQAADRTEAEYLLSGNQEDSLSRMSN